MPLRIALREPRPDDAKEFIALNRRSRRNFAGSASPPDTPQKFRNLLRRMERADYKYWLVLRRGDKTILGGIELSQIARGNFKSAYLGYQIGEIHARQGYMGEALVLALRMIFGRLRLHRVEANIQPTNIPSISLVKRLGFHREGYSRRYLKIRGRWRDHERWTMLVEEWRRG